MENSLVSVIITTYKRHFDQIIPSVHSALEQTYDRIEIVLIDDNGKNSEYQSEIENGLKKLQTDRDIIYIPNEKNSGAQVSRNVGILNSGGDYLAFLDDDDRWSRDKIERQINVFNTSDAGLVFSKGWDITVTDNDEIVKDYNMSSCFIEKLRFQDLSYGDYIGTTSQVLVRKDVFANVGLFDIDQPARQDYEMWIRISEKYECIGVPEYLFYHYHHQGEQISKNPMKSMIGYERIFNKYKRKSSATAKMHLSSLILKGCFQVKDYLKASKFLFLTAYFGIFSFMFAHNELKKRIQLHNRRK